MENQLSFDVSAPPSNPFGPATESGYPYLSSSFREALAALYYGLEYGSRILMLTAERGLGKTTLLRHFEGRMHGRSHTLLLSPGHDRDIEVLRKMLVQIGTTDPSDDLHAIRTQIDETLASADHTPFVLVLDYDENAAESALEILRCLASLESFDRRLLRVVLGGPPSIAEKLQTSALADDVRRVPLAPLTAGEVESYIDYRLRRAGWRGSHPFTAEACGLVAEESSGNPLAVNKFCFNLLQNPVQSELSPSDSAARNNYALSNGSDVTAVAPGRTASDSVLAALFSSRTYALAGTVLLLLLGAEALWYQIPIKQRTAGHRSAAITAPLDRLLHYARIHAWHPQSRHIPESWHIPTHAIAAASAASKSPVDNPAATPASEPTGTGETGRLSSLASPAAPPVLSATLGRTTVSDSAVVSPASAAPSAISSPPASAALPNAAAQSAEMAANKNQNGISAPLSQVKVPAQVPASPVTMPPAPQPAPVIPRAASHTVAVTPKENHATHTADSVAAYEIGLGDAYMNAGKYDYALNSFSRAIAFSPGNKEAEERLDRARRAKATEANLLH